MGFPDRFRTWSRLVAILLALAVGLGGTQALADVDYDFPADDVYDDSIAERTAIVENRLELYMDLSRTSAKEGLALAFQDFSHWFPIHNEIKVSASEALMRSLLGSAADVILLGVPASGVLEKIVRKVVVGDIVKGVRNARTREVHGNTTKFLRETERLYSFWILDKGLDGFRQFRQQPDFHGLVDAITEDFEGYTIEEQGVAENQALRSLLTGYGIPAPGDETVDFYRECGLFHLIKQTVRRMPPTTTGETPWDFLDLDIDTFVHDIMRDGEYTSKPGYLICKR